MLQGNLEMKELYNSFRVWHLHKDGRLYDSRSWIRENQTGQTSTEELQSQYRT